MRLMALMRCDCVVVDESDRNTNMCVNTIKLRGGRPWEGEGGGGGSRDRGTGPISCLRYCFIKIQYQIRLHPTGSAYMTYDVCYRFVH